MINFNNKQMNVTSTAKNGVVNEETIFHFSQLNKMVSANYSGGFISQGYLVGQIREQKLFFTYCQLQHDGKLDHGSSECDIVKIEEGKLQLVEHFTWGSREEEKGTNIFEEIN